VSHGEGVTESGLEEILAVEIWRESRKARAWREVSAPGYRERETA
jgi:hypothetical protein